MVITEARVRKGHVCAKIRTIEVVEPDLMATLDSYMVPRWQWHASDGSRTDYFLNGTTLVRWDEK